MVNLTIASVGFILSVDVFLISICLFVLRWDSREADLRRKYFEDEEKCLEKKTTVTISTTESSNEGGEIELIKDAGTYEETAHILPDAREDKNYYTAIASKEQSRV